MNVRLFQAIKLCLIIGTFPNLSTTNLFILAARAPVPSARGVAATASAKLFTRTIIIIGIHFFIIFIDRFEVRSVTKRLIFG